MQMTKALSPLRYPGGKACLDPIVSNIIRLNKMDFFHYAEPYAGGCGLALSLMFSGYVSEIHINDIDPSIWSFWHAVLEHTEDLVELINETEVTVKEWRQQRDIQVKEDISNPLELGFSAFYLNRTNRSGIISKAGIIGGFSQSGDYKIDCRFNKENLIHRIRRIRKYKSRIHLTQQDAVSFMQNSGALPQQTLFCIDPPYFNKGSSLYTSFYAPSDHEEVAQSILSLNYPWIVTYDNTEEIRKLYRERRQFTFDINYSLQSKRIGTELMITSKGLRLPEKIKERKISPIHGQQPLMRCSA